MDSANAASAASPRNKGSLAQRVVSAVVLLPIIAGMVWWSVWAVAAIVLIATIISLVELYGAFRQGGYRPRLVVGLASSMLLLGAITLRVFSSVDLVLPAITCIIIASLAVELTRHQEAGVLASWSLTVSGAFYISWLLSHFILLRSLNTTLGSSVFSSLQLQIDSGAAWIYFVLAITFIQDTAAYFAGKNFGRHKMAPILSPKKTWEGAAGGLAGSIAAALICVPLLGLPISLLQAGLIGIVGGIAGPIGDLAESMIKRQVGLKDAGNLIPGHGGILDRADSLLFTAPILYYLIQLFIS